MTSRWLNALKNKTRRTLPPQTRWTMSNPSQVVASALGISVPVALGVLTAHPHVGIAVSLGGLALGGEGQGDTLRELVRGLVYALVAGCAAILIGSTLAAHGVATLLLPLVAALAALFGGISRPLARATTLFMLYAIIAANMGSQPYGAFGMLGLFFIGGAWTTGLFLALRQIPFMRPTPAIAGHREPAPQYSEAQLFNRWRRSLDHLAGWQYALRVALCLYAAEAFDWIWPHHHGYWAAITIVIVVQRNLQIALAVNLKRAVGTAAGVLLTSTLLLWSPPVWGVVAMLAALAAARPILREFNFVLYTMFITPLIILLLDFGHVFSWTIVTDRLVATLAGCLIALVLGIIVWPAHTFHQLARRS